MGNLEANALRRRAEEPQISIAPLIDMMFILLIFFLVAASFERQAALEVERPRAATATPSRTTPLSVVIKRDGSVYFRGERTDCASLRYAVSEALKGAEREVIVVADKGAPVGRLVDVLDACRLGGAKRLSIAAEEER